MVCFGDVLTLASNHFHVVAGDWSMLHVEWRSYAQPGFRPMLHTAVTGSHCQKPTYQLIE